MPAMTTMPKAIIRHWLIPAMIEGSANGSRIFTEHLARRHPGRLPELDEVDGRPADAEGRQADRRRHGDDEGRRERRRRAEAEQRDRRQQIDVGRHRLDEVEHRLDEVVELRQEAGQDADREREQRAPGRSR